MIRGYRNPSKNFGIESDIEQFNFCLSDAYLLVQINWEDKSKLAPIERVQIFLKDKRCLKNVFFVNGQLAYYYQKEWYYTDDVREEVPKPPENIMSRFCFSVNDILLIISDNNPKPAKFDIAYWFSLFKYNQLDSKKSIENNIFLKEVFYRFLPKLDTQHILYFKK